MPPHRPLPRDRSRARILASITVGVAIVAGLVGAAPSPSRAADGDPGSGPTVLGSSVTFHGRGYGHGVGMSQHGARGRALDGQTASEILAHYYQGTTEGAIATSTRVRVRVLTGFRASSTRPLVLVARRTDWRIDGVDGVFPRDSRVEVRPRVTTTRSGTTSVSWRLRVISPAGVVLRDAATSHFRMRGVTSGSILQVASRSGKNKYRGVLRAVLSGTTRTAHVVNELDMERYLRGVVPAEMPSTWPTEALKAQAIAARSYAARHLRRGSWYDFGDDTSAQVYLGFAGEKAATSAAVRATAGVVLRSGSSVANTLFHSTGGGATEDNENVFVSSTGNIVAGAVGYLRGSPDRREDGSAYDRAAPYATWSTRTYGRSQLSAWFAADARTDVGTLTALDLTHRGVSGRLISVTLIGSEGTRRVSGAVFRSVFNKARPAGDPMLRSTLFDTAPIP